MLQISWKEKSHVQSNRKHKPIVPFSIKSIILDGFVIYERKAY